MAREIRLSPGEIALLGCINLDGLNRQKLTAVRRLFDLGEAPKVIHLKEDPSVLLVLDGHHTAYEAMKRSMEVLATVWEREGEIEDPGVRLNFVRGYQFHETAVIKGVGFIGDLRE